MHKSNSISKFILRIALSSAAALLVVPGASFALSHEPPLGRYEDQVVAYEEHDKKSMPKPDSTIFVGSSTIAKWRTLETDLKDCNAVNRGFGGSTIPEINYFLNRVVVRYKPARVIFYAGTNDIAEGHTAKRVCDDFTLFANAVHKALPKTQIFFVSMSVGPSRLKLKSVYDEGNELVKKLCASRSEYLHYIDVLPVMRTPEGELKDELFLPDSLHMTSVGYAKWSAVIHKALAASVGGISGTDLKVTGDKEKTSAAKTGSAPVTAGTTATPGSATSASPATVPAATSTAAKSAVPPAQPAPAAKSPTTAAPVPAAAAKPPVAATPAPAAKAPATNTPVAPVKTPTAK